MIVRLMLATLKTAAWLAGAGCAAWAAGALFFDSPWPSWRTFAAVMLVLAFVAAVTLLPGIGSKLGALFGGFLLVLAWWLTLQPSNTRNWQPDVARTAWAGIEGDTVTLHDVRNCDYRTETDYTPRWLLPKPVWLSTAVFRIITAVFGMIEWHAPRSSFLPRFPDWLCEEACSLPGTPEGWPEL